jgi:hypothetical protein
LSDRDTVIVNSEIGLKDVSDEYIPIFAFLMQGKKPKRQKVSSRCQIESLALAEYLKNHEVPQKVEASSAAFEAEVFEGVATDLEESDGGVDDESFAEEDFPEEDYLDGGDEESDDEEE